MEVNWMFAGQMQTQFKLVAYELSWGESVKIATKQTTCFLFPVFTFF